MGYRTWFGIISIALLSTGSAAAECACPQVPAPADAFKRATTAFIGSAEKVTRSPVKEGYMEARFTIMKRLKGFDEILGDKVFVFTPDKPENCGYPFSPGQDYVVFAQGNPAGLRTTSCLGTVYLDNVTGEIDSLLKLSDAAASASRATVTLSPAPGAPKITATPRTPPTPKTDSPPLLDLGDE